MTRPGFNLDIGAIRPDGPVLDGDSQWKTLDTNARAIRCLPFWVVNDKTITTQNTSFATFWEFSLPIPPGPAIGVTLKLIGSVYLRCQTAGGFGEFRLNDEDGLPGPDITFSNSPDYVAYRYEWEPAGGLQDSWRGTTIRLGAQLRSGVGVNPVVQMTFRSLWALEY